jgi:hypothetical protein
MPYKYVLSKKSARCPYFWQNFLGCSAVYHKLDRDWNERMFCSGVVISDDMKMDTVERVVPQRDLGSI